MTEINLHDEVHALLSDIRRHLEWQQDEGGTALLADRAVMAAARLARPTTAQPPRDVSPLAAPQPARSAEAAPRQPGSDARPLAAKRPYPSSVPGAATDPAPSVAPLNPQYRHPFVQPTPTPAPVQVPAPPPAFAPLAASERKTLDEVRRDLGDCTRCGLCSDRRNLVFGVGNPRAQLVFIGEAPGTEEDAQGVPFVGEAGQLLTKMIEAMGFTRDEVYLSNVVKCRPPDNRKPLPQEVHACDPFLRAQIAAIQPKVIVALGAFATQTLLRDESKISQIRGTWREYAGIPLMPTFHPTYLLKNPTQKKAAWSDLQQVMKVFGKLPQRGE
ncbi:MAG: uracil-DNA glycosylase family protein [Myxococcaceae bacterium]